MKRKNSIIILVVMSICLSISFYCTLLDQKTSEITQPMPQVEITQPISQVEITQSTKVDKLSKLPEGWSIVKSTSTGKYRWKDSGDWMSPFNEDTYEEAVKDAIETLEYRKRKEKEKWKPVNK